MYANNFMVYILCVCVRACVCACVRVDVSMCVIVSMHACNPDSIDRYITVKVPRVDFFQIE